MITLYTAPTPNGWKISIALEEMGLDYEVVPLNLLGGEQHLPTYVAMNPNGKIPTIVDHEAGDFVVFESAAILLYLAEKTGKLLPDDPQERSRAIQWLMFQTSHLGPMMGQANVFFRYMPEKIQPAIDRYHREGRRLMEVLDGRLAGREYLVSEYSIADIACWAWAHTYKWSGIDVSGLPNLRRWRQVIRERPAVERGRGVPFRLEVRAGDAEQFAEAARRVLV